VGPSQAAKDDAFPLEPFVDIPRFEAEEHAFRPAAVAWSLAAILTLESAAVVWAMGSGKIPPVVLSLFRAILTF
jgi:hypothetical protein